jgi:hypothetical protein
MDIAFGDCVSVGGFRYALILVDRATRYNWVYGLKDLSRSHTQAHTMDGIAVGCSPTSNALLVYNPRTKKYYEPDSYRFDPYRLPSSVYPSLSYDGGLFCLLYRDDNPTSMEELHPPGTRIERLDPSTNMLLVGTVMNIPLQSSPEGSTMYQVLFDNGTSASIPLGDMASLIPRPPVSGDAPSTSSSDTDSSLLPPFLQVGSRITFEHNGEYHKGFLTRNTSGTYRFSFKHILRRSLRTGA